MRCIRMFACLLLILYLGQHQGFLALWSSGRSVPASILPCRVDMLPKHDQKMLESGIPISSSDELTKLLQDYLS